MKDLLAMENGILSVRNLGQKSAKEIKQLFFEECYTRLLPYEKAYYWQEILEQSNLNLQRNDSSYLESLAVDSLE